jgi:DNA-binding GntR family transcriptional regulator
MTSSVLVGPDQIAESLRSAILEREFAPGTVLNQGTLAAQFGVSRIPLREALRTLAAEGLITNRPGVGSIVTELTPEDVGELYDIRLALEPPLAESIIDNVSRRQVTQLESRVNEMQAHQASGERAAFSGANYRFHQDLYAIALTRYTRKIIFLVMNLTEPYSRVYLHVLHGMERAQTEHREMLEAISAADAARLRVSIEEHLTGAREALVRLATFGSETAAELTADR